MYDKSDNAIFLPSLFIKQVTTNIISQIYSYIITACNDDAQFRSQYEDNIYGQGLSEDGIIEWEKLRILEEMCLNM